MKRRVCGLVATLSLVTGLMTAHAQDMDFVHEICGKDEAQTTCYHPLIPAHKMYCEIPAPADEAHILMIDFGDENYCEPLVATRDGKPVKVKMIKVSDAPRLCLYRLGQ